MLSTRSFAVRVAPQPPPRTRWFAEIPELVFVRGYAETLQLGVFLIDVANRWTPGDFSRASGWFSQVPVSLTGGLPPGVSFDAYTMELSYDGSGSGLSVTPVRLELSDGTRSRQFELTILQPTVTWGYGGQVDPTGYTSVANADPVSWHQTMRTRFTPGARNCLLVLPGTYTNMTGNTTDFLNNGGAGDYAYVVGAPGTRPKLVYRGENQRLSMRLGKQFYVKHLEVDGRDPGGLSSGIKWTPTSLSQAVIWGVEVTQNAQEPFSLNPLASYGGKDAFEFRAMEAFIIHCKGYTQGTAALSHMHYHHLGSFTAPNDMDPAYTFANRALLHVNNGWWGSSPYGHTLKIECSCTVRNNVIQSANDSTDPALTDAQISGYAPLQLHVNMRNVVYNNRVEHIFSTARGQRMGLFVGCRNVNEGGGTLPPYWADSSISDNPASISEITARGLGELFHGATSFNAYPVNDVPFWNLVGYRPLGDPLNVWTYDTWLAFNAWSVPDVKAKISTQQFNNIAHRHDSSAPHQGLGSFAAQHYFLPVPRNWRNMARAFAVNNAYTNYPAASGAMLHQVGDGFGATSDSLATFPEGALPYPKSEVTVLSDEGANQQDALVPAWFVLSFDFLPTSLLRQSAEALAGAGSAGLSTGLSQADANMGGAPLATGQNRFYWSGEEALWLAKGASTRVLSYSAKSNTWTRVVADGSQPGAVSAGTGVNHSCLDHLGKRLFFREAGSNRLQVLDLAAKSWTTSSAAPAAISTQAVAIAWHPHLFDDFSVRDRDRGADFHGGVVLYEPGKLWAYDPDADVWSLVVDNAGPFDGAGALSAVYVRALGAVVFGGGLSGAGRVWRLKHATATPELLGTAPANFGAEEGMAVMLDDPTGNGVLLLEKGAGASRAWRWFSKDNSAAGGAWTQLSDHPFEAGGQGAPWVACSVETEHVVMGVCHTGAGPEVRLWRPDPGFIPRLRGS